MSKITPIHYRRIAKVFEAAGFRKVRKESSHMVYAKSGVMRPVVIPKYQEIPVFVIKNNLRTGNISREEYFKLLKAT